MPKSSLNVSLKAADDIFSTEESRQEEKWEQVQQIPLAELFPFKNHPFKVLDDESMQRTVESVEQYGVLSPLIARPRPEGGYEIISGHRRQHAAQLAGLDTLPVIVREMDDDAAILLMVDSNLQRESILPSERAFAYKMKLEAMKRTSGRPSKENVSQIGTQKRSDQIMAEELGESRNQIQRFIRLTNLIPELLDIVDEKKISFNPAVELSYLDEAQQRDFLEAMNDTQNFPSLSQAQRLKKLAQEGHFSYDVAFAVIVLFPISLFVAFLALMAKWLLTLSSYVVAPLMLYIFGCGIYTAYRQTWDQFFILLVAEFICFVLFFGATAITEGIGRFSEWLAEL